MAPADRITISSGIRNFGRLSPYPSKTECGEHQEYRQQDQQPCDAGTGDAKREASRRSRRKTETLPPVCRGSVSGGRVRSGTQSRRRSGADYGLPKSVRRPLHRSGNDRSEYGGSGLDNKREQNRPKQLDGVIGGAARHDIVRRVIGTLSGNEERTADWESRSRTRPPRSRRSGVRAVAACPSAGPAGTPRTRGKPGAARAPTCIRRGSTRARRRRGAQFVPRAGGLRTGVPRGPTGERMRLEEGC